MRKAERRGRECCGWKRGMRKNRRKGEGERNEIHMESPTAKEEIKMKVDRM